jgi:hypothetical protein
VWVGSVRRTFRATAVSAKSGAIASKQVEGWLVGSTAGFDMVRRGQFCQNPKEETRIGRASTGRCVGAVYLRAAR